MVAFGDSGFGGFDFFRGPDCSMSWGDPLFFATGAGIPIFQGILPGENSINFPLGTGGPFGDIWQALGLPSGLSCPQVGGVSDFLCGGVNPIMDAKKQKKNLQTGLCHVNNVLHQVELVPSYGPPKHNKGSAQIQIWVDLPEDPNGHCATVRQGTLGTVDCYVYNQHGSCQDQLCPVDYRPLNTLNGYPVAPADPDNPGFTRDNVCTTITYPKP